MLKRGVLPPREENRREGKGNEGKGREGKVLFGFSFRSHWSPHFFSNLSNVLICLRPSQIQKQKSGLVLELELEFDLRLDFEMQSTINLDR